MFLESCTNYCTDQFSLKQSHMWQYFPLPAFIQMGGFVLLVLISPYLMPVSYILSEVQTSSVKIPCHCKQYMHTQGKTLIVPLKKLPHLYSSTTSCKALVAHQNLGSLDSAIVTAAVHTGSSITPKPVAVALGSSHPNRQWLVGNDGKRPTALSPAGTTN